jgi:hypothetical protein
MAASPRVLIEADGGKEYAAWIFCRRLRACPLGGLCSDTATSPCGRNLAAADEGLRQTIAKEKSEAGKDMVIFAGAKFASTAIREGLVDEYSLLTIPMLFGGGSRLFDGGGSRQETAPS